VLTGEFVSISVVLIMDSDGCFAFESSYNTRNGVLGRDAKNKMDVIGTEMSFKFFYSEFFKKFRENLPNMDSELVIDDFLSVLWTEDNMIDTVTMTMSKGYG
jgi:hypothetical protein